MSFNLVSELMYQQAEKQTGDKVCEYCKDACPELIDLNRKNLCRSCWQWFIDHEMKPGRKAVTKVKTVPQCKMCGKVFEKTGRNHIYCGNFGLKRGCSYKHKLDKQREVMRCRKNIKIKV